MSNSSLCKLKAWQEFMIIVHVAVFSCTDIKHTARNKWQTTQSEQIKTAAEVTDE